MKLLIWDFDGTLGYRHGMWSGALLEVIDANVPTHQIEASMLRANLRDGFPWHKPDQIHTHIKTADAWWGMMMPVFERAFISVGFTPNDARDLALQTRMVYPCVDAWDCFDDTIPTLKSLSYQGWTHVVLSNHVPELEAIMTHLGLTTHMDAIFNSAFIGYEKPHPQAFQMVLNQYSNVETVWMIGDNPIADIAGAQAVGVPGILVRNSSIDIQYTCETLSEVSSIIVKW